MPITERQRKKFGADLQRARRGEKTETGMSEQQLKHMLSTEVKSGRERKKKKEKKKKRKLGSIFTD